MFSKRIILGCGLAFLLTSCCTEESCKSDSDVVAATADEISDMNLDSTNVEFNSIAGDRVFFAFDSDALTADAMDILTKQAEWLIAHPHEIIIEGYCDERGTREYNLALGMRRANSVREFLVAQGVNPNSILVNSYGKDKPIEVMGSQEEVWRQNRTAITVINQKISQ